ncbi:hypothetical protein QQ045_027467 [Rhodiola kirilowii]
MSFTRCTFLAALSLAAFLLSAPAAGVTDSVLAPVLAPEMAPGPDCFTVLLNMSDCLTFVEEGSNLTQPEKPCCSELAGLVDTNPICLCKLLGNAGSFGVQIDLSRAMKLPDACRVSTPPVSSCSAVGVPVGAPFSSSPAPFGSSDTAEVLTPSTANKDSGASSLRDIALVSLTALTYGLVHIMV